MPDVPPTGSYHPPDVPRVPGYEALEELGRGGMGVVYLARDVRLGRLVALKVLNDDLADEPAAVERFLREARLASSLNHPHVCSVYALGERDGRPFLVLELIKGRTLRAFAAERPSLAERLRVASQVAEALAAAHRAGLVHRDVKPSNVMVDQDGRAKVLDFGLARPVAADPAGEVTRPGTVLGTLRYMAPEQARAEPVGPPADVFALGIVAYELLTGRHPFPGASDLESLAAAQSREPAPAGEVNPEVGPDLAALLSRLLEKTPARRPTAAEAARELTRLAAAPAAAVPAASHPTVTVGRSRERQALGDAFAAARSGRGLLVGVAGEPGLGKTTLVEGALAGLSDCLIARGRCSERLAGAEAYLPLLEALDDLARGPAGEEVTRLLKAVAPTWYAQAAPGGGEALSQAQTELKHASTERLKRELLAFLHELSRSRPLVLFLDDLHWADVSTTDVLSYLAPRCGGSRLLVLLTYRPADLARDRHPFHSLRRDLLGRGSFRELALEFLGRDDLTHYLDLTFPGHRFPSDLVALLHARTEGNPLFMTGLLGYLRDRGALAQRDGAWALSRPVADMELELPDSVRGLIEQKLERFREDDRSLLAFAAVHGPEFDSAVVARAAGRDAGEVEARLVAMEREHDLIRLERERDFPGGAPSARYRFVHVLYHDALSGSLTPTRRVRLSAAVAEALLGLAGDQAAAELALLFEAARDWPRAVHFFLRATQAATRVHAFHEAVPLARRGLKALDRLPAGQERDRSEIDLLVALGTDLVAGQGLSAPAMPEACERALRLCGREGCGEAVPRLLSGVYMFHLTRGDIGLALELAARMRDWAEAAAKPSLQVVAQYITGQALFYRAGYARALEAFDRCIALEGSWVQDNAAMLKLIHPPSGSRCFAVQCLFYLGYPDRSRARLLDVLALAGGEAPANVRVFALGTAAIVWRYARDPRRALEYADAVVAGSDESGLGQWRSPGMLVRGWAWLEQGELARGLDEIQRATAAYREAGSAASLPWYLLELAEALGKSGRPTEGLAVLADLPIVQERGVWHRRAEGERIRGRLLLAAGRPAEAEAALRQALALAREDQARWFELRAALTLCRMLRDQGRREEARRELAAVYGWFTEGHDTQDLIEARALLSALQQ
jgi:tetratricopeptide (TPR) repeat protein